MLPTGIDGLDKGAQENLLIKAMREGVEIKSRPGQWKREQERALLRATREEEQPLQSPTGRWG
jgi:hypothetical protein